MISYPKDGNRWVISDLTASLPALAKTYSSDVSTSNEVTLNAATSLIEVSAIAKPVFLKWGTSDASSSDFDEIILDGKDRTFFVPLNPNSNIVTLDSYSEANQSSVYTVNALGFPIPTAMGHSFTPISTIPLDSCVFYIRRNGALTGNIVTRVYKHSGVYGTSSVPTGEPLASSNLMESSTLTTSLALVTFTFEGENRIPLVAGSNYFLSLEYLGSDAANTLGVGGDSTQSHGGNRASKLSTTGWTASGTTDLVFYVYGDTGDRSKFTAVNFIEQAPSAALAVIEK